MAGFAAALTLNGLAGWWGAPKAGKEAVSDDGAVLVMPLVPKKASVRGLLCLCFRGLSLPGESASAVIILRDVQSSTCE